MPPPILPGYEVGGLLGRGGFATVWEARPVAHPQPVAIKVGHGTDLWNRQRFEREAEALRRVGAPHVPHLHDSGVSADDRPYIAMELLRGQPLAAALEMRAEPPALSWTLDVIEAVLAALGHMHALGLAHCDLKPENIVLLEGDPHRVRIVDLGLVTDVGARAAMGRDAPALGAGAGSLEYMAPEQIRGEADVDLAADIYAVGVLIYELTTLRPPFVGDAAAIEYGHLYLRPPRPQSLAVVPATLVELILGCLAKVAAKRPAPVSQLGEYLERVREDELYEAMAVPVAPLSDESSRPLLAERRQPAVVLVADAGVSASGFESCVREQGGFVAKRSRAHTVAVFPGAQLDDPARAALASARVIVDRLGGNAALHAAPLVIRPRQSGPPVVRGEAVEQPEEWLPRARWQGIVLTHALAASLPADATMPAAEGEGFAVPAARRAPAQELRLVGRADALARARESLRACLETATPGLFTIVAAQGMGRSRLLREIDELARAMRPEAVVRRHALADGELAPAALEGIDALPVGTPLVLLIDDAHLARDEVLDRIEHLTLDTDNAPIWIAVAALPRLEETRPRWGVRANRHERVTLRPLDEGDAMALSAELLLPAEYPPADFLRALVGWAGCRPLYLVRLVAELKRRGLVRPRAGGEGFYVAASELGDLPALAAEQWLASRELEGMTPELAACVRVCAVLGPTFHLAELVHVLDALDRTGSAGTTMDAGVGTGELSSRGLLEQLERGRFAFTSAAFREAIYSLLGSDDRARIHVHAADYWRARLVEASDDAVALERFAQHADACGLMGEAAAAFLELGHMARRRHQDTRADAFYTAAVRTAGAAERAALRSIRAAALGGRGHVRYRLHRLADAIDDLRAARAAAESLEQHALVVELLLEEATALDWAGKFEESAERTEEAARRADSTPDVLSNLRLSARLRLARGRTHWRRGQVTEAIAALDQAVTGARAAGDGENKRIGRLLLALALVLNGQLDEAEEHFAQVISQCEASGDALHLCGAYANRMFLWSVRKQTERAVADLRRAIDLAREIGNPTPETIATHNLAELLYWSGDDDESLVLAHRALRLHERFGETAIPEHALLVARVHAARGEIAEAHSFLAWIESHCPEESLSAAARVLQDMLRLVIASSTRQVVGAADWDALLERARAALPGEELVEMLWWRMRLAVRYAKWGEAASALGEARERLGEVPIWRQRIDALAERIPDHAF
ncbi:MAG TPA: protein kinase [Haliangium sp.]|nr:protein kinase [Haliangium sp.]